MNVVGGLPRLELLHYIADLPDDALLTEKEVAIWFLVEPAWVRAHANGNRKPVLPSVKIGKFRRFVKSHVNQFLRDLNGHI